MTTQPNILNLKLTKLNPLPSNPNHMDDLKFLELKNIIEKYGFLQPITVKKEGKAYTIIDGVHRFRAAQELGFEDIPCVVADSLQDIHDARAIQIGMNKLRGEMNMSEVATIMQAMVDDGWGAEELLITGFDPDDISFMLDSVAKESKDILDDFPVMPQEKTVEEEFEDVKTFVLELSFTEKAKYNKAKRLLKKAAGSGDLADGLINLLEEV